MRRQRSTLLSGATSVLPLAAQTANRATDGGLNLDGMTEVMIRADAENLAVRVIAETKASRCPVAQAHVISGKPIRDLFHASAGRGVPEGQWAAHINGPQNAACAAVMESVRTAAPDNLAIQVSLNATSSTSAESRSPVQRGLEFIRR